MFGLLGRVVGGAKDAPADLSELLVGLDTPALADLIAGHEEALTRLADFRLVLAAAWADHHSGTPGRALFGERSVEVGGAGTPSVAEGGVDEFGDLSKISNGAARRLIGDVLDLRHRMPRLWSRVCTGGVLDWQARKIAQATRPLSIEAAGWVDRKLEPWVGQLSWARLVTLVDAEVLAADPERAAALAVEAEGAMGVWSGSVNERGVKSVYARTDPVSAAWFMGMVNRIADLLAADGDSRTADRRRAAAVGILARPADAIALLARHATGPSTSSGNASGPSTGSGNGAGPSTGSGNEELTLHEDVRFTLPEPVEGPSPVSDDELRQPDDTDDQAGVAEYRPTGHPAERPERAPLQEPADTCSCQPEPQLRTPVELPAGLNLKAARPKVVLHFHLSDEGLSQAGGQALVRPGQGDPARLTELINWLAGTGCQIVVQPVIDPAATAPADAYEIPDRVRTAVRYRDIADVSPWGTSTSPSLDLDHTRSYRALGPPGQTSLGNLGPFVRPVHRVKTVGAKHVRQPEPGVFIWRSQHGHISLVTNRGTISLGSNAYAERIWRAADHPKSIVETKLAELYHPPFGIQLSAA